MLRISSIMFILWISLPAFSQAQAKYAHINSGNLLAAMPEVKAADNQLIALRKSMLAEGNKRLSAFEKKYQAFVTDAQAGKLSKTQIATQEKALQKEQEGLVKYDQEIGNKIAAKREQLLKPVLTKVDNIIKQIAKEKGYLMVFDSSSGTLLYARDSEDIMALVKARLGLKAATTTKAPAKPAPKAAAKPAAKPAPKTAAKKN